MKTVSFGESSVRRQAMGGGNQEPSVPGRTADARLQTLYQSLWSNQSIASLLLWAGWLILLACAAAQASELDSKRLPPAAATKVDFARHVYPLLKAHCLK